MNLHGPVRRRADKVVGPKIAHADSIAERVFHARVRHLVHGGGRLEDEQAEGSGLGVEADEGELDGLVGGEGGPKGVAGERVADGATDAVLCGAEGAGGLADAVLVDEGLRDGQAAAFGSEEGGVGDEDLAHVSGKGIGMWRRRRRKRRRHLLCGGRPSHDR